MKEKRCSCAGRKAVRGGQCQQLTLEWNFRKQMSEPAAKVDPVSLNWNVALEVEAQLTQENAMDYSCSGVPGHQS